MSDKISVRDFKSMIEGMDTVLGDEWVPTAEQWKKIRERIRQLDDAPPVPVVAPTEPTAPRPALYRAYPPPSPPDQPDVAEEALLRTFPQVPASVPANIPVTVRPGQSAFSQPAAPAPPRPSIPSVPRATPPPPAVLAKLPPAQRDAALKASAVKTPDIDSSKGYNSTYV